MANAATILTLIREGVDARKSEGAERNAVVKVLARYGYRKLPSIEVGSSGGLLIRVFRWKGAVNGRDILLITGPGIEGEVRLEGSEEEEEESWDTAKGGAWVQLDKGSLNAKSKAMMKRMAGRVETLGTVGKVKKARKVSRPRPPEPMILRLLVELDKYGTATLKEVGATSSQMEKLRQYKLVVLSPTRSSRGAKRYSITARGREELPEVPVPTIPVAAPDPEVIEKLAQRLAAIVIDDARGDPEDAQRDAASMDDITSSAVLDVSTDYHTWRDMYAGPVVARMREVVAGYGTVGKVKQARKVRKAPPKPKRAAALLDLRERPYQLMGAREDQAFKAGDIELSRALLADRERVLVHVASANKIPHPPYLRVMLGKIDTWSGSKQARTKMKRTQSSMAQTLDEALNYRWLAPEWTKPLPTSMVEDYDDDKHGTATLKEIGDSITTKGRSEIEADAPKTTTDEIILVATSQDARTLAGDRTFRAPHYSVGRKGIESEADMARNGVLFLGEVEQFRRGEIEALASYIRTRGFPGDVVVTARPEGVEKALWDTRVRTLYDAVKSIRAEPPSEELTVLSSGFSNLDEALGTGGYMRGRVTSLFYESWNMPVSTANATLTGMLRMGYTATAAAQASGHKVLWVDAARRFDSSDASVYGIERLLDIVQPDNATIVTDEVVSALKSGSFGMIIVDGWAHAQGMTPRKASAWLRDIAGKAASGLYNRPVVLFLDSGSKEENNAQKYYASVRIKVRADMDDRTIDADVVKNKFAPPFKHAKLEGIFPVPQDVVWEDEAVPPSLQRVPERLVAIWSPFGNGQLYVGGWDRAYSPLEMIQANRLTLGGFKWIGGAELAEYQAHYGDQLPTHPGEWSELEWSELAKDVIIPMEDPREGDAQMTQRLQDYLDENTPFLKEDYGDYDDNALQDEKRRLLSIRQYVHDLPLDQPKAHDALATKVEALMDKLLANVAFIESSVSMVEVDAAYEEGFDVGAVDGPTSETIMKQSAYAQLGDDAHEALIEGFINGYQEAVIKFANWEYPPEGTDDVIVNAYESQVAMRDVSQWTITGYDGDDVNKIFSEVVDSTPYMDAGTSDIDLLGTWLTTILPVNWHAWVAANATAAKETLNEQIRDGINEDVRKEMKVIWQKFDVPANLTSAIDRARQYDDEDAFREAADEATGVGVAIAAKKEEVKAEMVKRLDNLDSKLIEQTVDEYALGDASDPDMAALEEAYDEARTHFGIRDFPPLGGYEEPEGLGMMGMFGPGSGADRPLRGKSRPKPVFEQTPKPKREAWEETKTFEVERAFNSYSGRAKWSDRNMRSGVIEFIHNDVYAGKGKIRDGLVESSARFPKNVIDEFDHQIIRYIEEHTSAEDFALLIRGGVPVVIPDPDPIDPVSIAESNYVAAIESSHDAHSPIDVDVAFDSYHINAMDTVAEMGGNKEQINAVSVLYLGLVEAWKDKQHDVEEERRLSRGPTSRELALSKRIAKQGKWIDLGEGEWTWRWHGMGYAHYVDTKKSYGNTSRSRYDVENDRMSVRYQDWREARAIALSTEAVPRLIADGYLNEQGVLSEEDDWLDPHAVGEAKPYPPLGTKPKRVAWKVTHELTPTQEAAFRVQAQTLNAGDLADEIADALFVNASIQDDEEEIQEAAFRVANTLSRRFIEDADEPVEPKGPDSKLIVSKHNPESVKVAIDMVYRKVRIRGETGMINLGLYDEVDKGLAIQVLRAGYLNRVDSNKPVTTKARMLVEELVLKELVFAKEYGSAERVALQDAGKMVIEFESVLSDVYNAISALENGEHPETNIPEGLDRLAEIAQNDDIAAWTGSSFNGWNRYESVKRDYEQAVSRIAAQSDADAALRVRLKEYISDAEKMLREEWSDYDDAGIEDEIRRTQSILDQLGEISTYDPEAERRKELAENLNRRLNRTVIAERDGRTVAPAQQMSPEPEPEDFMERFTSGLRSLLTD